MTVVITATSLPHHHSASLSTMADTCCANCGTKCVYNRTSRKYNRKTFIASLTTKAGGSSVADALAEVEVVVNVETYK